MVGKKIDNIERLVERMLRHIKTAREAYEIGAMQDCLIDIVTVQCGSREITRLAKELRASLLSMLED